MFYCFDTIIAEKFGIYAAVLFQNIAYWVVRNQTNKREMNLHEDKYWTYNTIQSFIDLFPFMTRYTIEKSLKILAESDMIEIGEFNDKPFDHTKWYTLGKLGQKVIASQRDKSVFQDCELDFSKTINGVLENENAIPNNKPDNKQEPIVRKNSFSPYSQENEKSEENIAAEPPATTSKYMAIAVEFFNSPSILTAFCKNNKVTYEQCEAIVDEIVTEWEFTQPIHNTDTEAKSKLLRALETKIRIKREHGLLDTDSRKEQFIADCKALKEEGYNKQDIARFYNYYIQPAQDGSDKCLFETYKAWNTKTRFKMFLKPPKK